MRNNKNLLKKVAAFAVVLTIAVTGCKKSNDEEVTPPTPTPDPLKTTYTLKAKDVVGLSGTVTIAETASGSSNSIVTITLTGAPAGTHPAHIHMNAAVEGGNVLYPLTDVDATGKSTTTLSILYGTLINVDGYINVHLDGGAGINTIIAQGDIGGNALTGDTKSYNLDPDSASGVSGTALFEKRKNGNTLVTVQVTGLVAGQMFPAYINLGSVTTVGIPTIKKTLNNVDGNTGKSITNIRQLDDNTVITYANWLVYDGFITIHDSMNPTNIIAKGNIGTH